jgi:hypothetical protein
MIIKKENINPTVKISSFRKVLKFIVCFTFIINIIVITLGGVLLKSHPSYLQWGVNKIKPFINLNLNHIPEILSYKIKSLLYMPERISIDVKHIDLQQIEFQRQKAMKGNIDFDYVPASIIYDGEKYKIKIRLKGGREAHYSDINKASYRIKIKKGKTILGMKTFSIHKPRTRNYIEEFIFLRMMRDEGMVTPRYKFVNINFNGKDNGVYAIEEHYTKHLIENNRHKDGPIIRFDEHTRDFKLETIQVYESKKWRTGSRFVMVKKAISLLEGFRNGKLSIRDVFDEKKLARFFAVADLNFAWHGVVNKSMRFYYNPITLKLEPVPYDGHRGASGETYLMSSELGITTEDNWTYNMGNANWFKTFFNNKESYSEIFYKEYISTLERISNRKYLDNFFQNHNDEITNILKLTYSELPLKDNIFTFGPSLYFFSKESYYNTQKNIKNKLNDHNIEANIVGIKKDLLILSVVNKHKSLPYEILNILDDNQTIIGNPIESHILLADSPLLLNIREKKNISFKCSNLDAYNNSLDLKLTVKYPGSKEVFIVDVNPWSLISVDSIKKDIVRVLPNLDKFKFIQKDDINKKIIIPTGSYTVNKDLIIPEGYSFVIEKNTEINIENNSIILSYSPCRWIGTKDQPISIFSKNKKDGSIVVFNKSELPHESKLSYVNFNNLAFPKIKDWMVSGSVNFYKAKVDLNNVNISSNDAEDALNLVNSSFTMDRVNFRNIKSDALDVDFGKGKLTNSIFSDIGNDAIDVSGTQLFIHNVKTVKVGDKALSAGEKSHITGNKLNILNTEIGIASKDGSMVNLNNVKIKDSKLGLTSFNKKSEYSNGTLILNDLIFNNVTRKSAVEINSYLTLNNQIIIGTIEEVDEILYGNQYGEKTNKQK